jgi:protein ImuB
VDAGAQLSLLSNEELSSRDDKHWDSELLALTDGAETRPKLRSVTAAAAREGVRAGMSVAEARALCASLELMAWDDMVIHDAITAATARLVELSPQVSPVAGAPGMWWVGASGFAPGSRLWALGSRQDDFSAASREPRAESVFAQALQHLASSWHPRARVAIAETCVAARAATWAGASFEQAATTRSLITIIPAGGDAEYLSSAPLTLLPMDAEMRDALRALGVRTVGQFADLNVGDVEQRWGDNGLSTWRLAHGDDPRRPVLARIAAAPHVEMELATPSDSMEPVLFLVRPAVERLVTQLVSESRAIAARAITLTLDDARGAMPTALAHTVTREIRLPRPLARTAPLFERCRGLLSRWELTAPVIAVRLTVVLTSPFTGEQGDLLDTSWRDPGAADAALERVRAEMGPDVVVKPVMRDGYAPERSGQWSEANPTTDLQARDGRLGTADRSASSGLQSAVSSLGPAVRLLATPESSVVDNLQFPHRFHWRGRAVRVTQAVGPERLSSDWWKDGFSRDYWRCERDDDAGELVLYRDASGWWVQGWYD